MDDILEIILDFIFTSLPLKIFSGIVSVIMFITSFCLLNLNEITGAYIFMGIGFVLGLISLISFLGGHKK